MNDKINEALKQFNREDLIDDGYERDLDSNIEVFLTIKQMIYYNQLQSNWNGLRELIEEEKTRLAKECSHTYEDSLGKTKYVNEDIFNELDKILDKMNELEGENNDIYKTN